MKVEVAKGAGFCNGVKAAFEKALALVQEYGKIYSLGELVHNELVTEFLASKGVVCLQPDKWSELKQGDVALIRAHGVPLEAENELLQKGVKLFDATCPVVKRNQMLAAERAKAGDSVIILGDPRHDEVVGLKNYAGDGCEVFETEDSMKITSKPTSILFQTTFPAEKFEKIKLFVEKIKKNRLNSVAVFNTICYATNAKQEEARLLAAKSDVILTVGSRTSANTRRLYEATKAVNDNAYFVSNLAEACKIKKVINNFQSVSIVAGASTPPWSIREVTQLMSETQAPDVIVEQTEAKEEATLQANGAAEATVATDAAEKTATAEKATDKAAADEKTDAMGALLKSARNAGGYTNYTVGKRITGKVISAGENGIYVAIGGKKDGFVDKSEASLDGSYNPADYKEGDEIAATIISVGKEYVSLSKKAIDARRKEDEEAEQLLSSDIFSLTMTEVVKNKEGKNVGLRGRKGRYNVFVPASQIKLKGYVTNLEDYVGKTLRLMIMPPRDGEETATEEARPAKLSTHITASQRMVLEKEQQEKEELFWNSIHVNDIVTGKVMRYAPSKVRPGEFIGAFVSVKGHDCLAHISHLSYTKIKHPNEVLTLGQSYDFVVMDIKKDKGEVSLGYKQLQKPPYEIAREKYPEGTVIKGKVERIANFGAFIGIEPGIDGLVHVSQMSSQWVKDPNDIVKVGQEVEAVVLKFEGDKITLSMKALLPEEPKAADNASENVEATDEERVARRNSQKRKFEQRADGEKKERRAPKKEVSNEPKEWVSGSGTASLGELIQGLDLKLADDDSSDDTPKE